MTQRNSSPLELAFFGAAPDTSNLGVSALCQSFLEGVARRAPDVRLAVFDNGWGIREGSGTVDGRTFSYRRFGGRNSRRIHRRDSLWNIRISARLGGLGNPAAIAIRRAHALLDISGGDSFTDLYGPRRFEAIVLPKLTAIDVGTPLILLPQTYGPFAKPRCRKIAEAILRNVAIAWARDERSFAALRELLGRHFDPARHKSGVDIAFAMRPVEPEAERYAEIEGWLNDSATPVVGFNVSGLVLNDPDEARVRYGLKADYGAVVTGFLRRLLDESDARIVLVPHVLGGAETDLAACERVSGELRDRGKGRVAVLPARFHQSEIKWVISRFDWFCGTRMHSTIAALSTGVPTASIAYSLKTLGVFETCGQGEHVADPRELDTEEVIDRVWRSWESRSRAKKELAKQLPDVLQRAEAQMDEVLTACGSPSAVREATR